MNTRTLIIGLASAAMASSMSPAQAETLITDVDTGILGVTVPYDGVTPPDDTGATTYQFNDSAANIVDGNTGTYGVNLTNGGGAGDLGWMGIRFSSAQNQVSAIEFVAQTFPDGGWFNTVNDTGNGQTLAPIVQITTADISGLPTTGATVISNTDGIWQTVSTTDDYPVVDGNDGNSAAVNAGIANGDVFRWTLDTPVDNVTGIRIFGSQGGSVGAKVGFLATAEIRAYQVPEPSSLALLGLGGLLVARRRRG